MMRKSLIFALILALLFLPIFLMAHVFTHYAQTEIAGVIQVDSNHDERNINTDIDEICLDCFASIALNILLITVLLFLLIQLASQLLAQLRIEYGIQQEPSLYYSRAPPVRSSWVLFLTNCNG